MQRLGFTLLAAALCAAILTENVRAEEDLPVVDVSTDTEATAEDVSDEVNAVANEAEAEAEAAVEAAFQEAENASNSDLPARDESGGDQGSAQTAVSTRYKPQGDWDLSVSEDENVEIRKIYEFLNDPKVTKTGKDKSLAYEFKYFNHGAITKAQRYNREGQYYVVTWTNHGAPADYELRIDYRQSKTRDKINTITIPYPMAKGTFKGTFSITGDHYYMNGGILSWRISVVRNDKIVAQRKSFVW